MDLWNTLLYQYECGMLAHSRRGGGGGVRCDIVGC